MTQETLYICFLKQVSFHVVNNWLISNIHVFSKYWIAKTIIQADIALTEMLKITKADFQQNPEWKIVTNTDAFADALL